MKDLEYSLIDTVSNAVNLHKEIARILKIVKRNLKKGRGTFLVTSSCSNLEEIEQYGFRTMIVGKYEPIFTGFTTKYEISITVDKKS